MDSATTRLISCFQIVFPDLPSADIPNASQKSVAAWDSVATITLVNVIEEEFQVQIDLDMVDEFDSFSSFLRYLRKECNVS